MDPVVELHRAVQDIILGYGWKPDDLLAMTVEQVVDAWTALVRRERRDSAQRIYEVRIAVWAEGEQFQKALQGLTDG